MPSLPAFVTPDQFFAGKEIGERVAVLDSDGYFMAVSMAEKLADSGRQVTLITPFDRVAPYTDLTLEGANLRRMMREKNIGYRVAHWVESAEAGAAIELSIFDILSRRLAPVAIARSRGASRVRLRRMFP